MKFFNPFILCIGIGCTQTPEPGPIIVLASFDTTRVDSISAYGGTDARTPVVDALADRGVRFEWALSPLPTTLGSHTAMMSGMLAAESIFEAISETRFMKIFLPQT